MIEKSTAKLQTTSNDMEMTLSEMAQTSFKEYLFQYLAAASVLNNQTIIAWFNGQPLHFAALSLNLVHNALIKTILGDDYGIRVTNNPLPFSSENNTLSFGNYDFFGSTFPIVIGVVMTLLSASYVGYHIKVRINWTRANKSVHFAYIKLKDLKVNRNSIGKGM